MGASLEKWARVSQLPRLLAARSPAFSLQQTRFNEDPSKDGTARRALVPLLPPGAHVYTLEASFWAAAGAGGMEPLTPERCARVRAGCGKCVCLF